MFLNFFFSFFTHLARFCLGLGLCFGPPTNFLYFSLHIRLIIPDSIFPPAIFFPGFSGTLIHLTPRVGENILEPPPLYDTIF